MAKAPIKKVSELGLAAQALDVELVRFNELVDAALRSPLNSEKNIERAAKSVMDAAACQERVSERVQALLATIMAVRDRQQSASEQVVARAHEIQRRGQDVASLMQRFAGLGEEARNVVAKVQSLGATPKEELPLHVQAIATDLAGVIGHAEEVVRSAAEMDLPDIGRQAESLRQQVFAARNRMLQLERQLAQSGA